MTAADDDDRGGGTMNLSRRQVRRLRKRIAYIGRCPVRPGLTHHWKEVLYVVDSTQFAPPAESGLKCNKCGVEES